MLWLVLTILFGITLAGGLIYGRGSTDPVARKGGMLTAGGAAVIWGIVTVFLSLHTVGQREVGIVYNFSGTIAGTRNAGVVMTAPWQHIKTENIGLQKEVFTFDTSNSAVSKDQQPLTAQLVVNYQVQPQQVVKLYKTVGPSWKTILLDGRVPQDFKETTAQFTSPQITVNRPEIRKITLNRLRNELAPYDVRVVDVFVNNIGYSSSYTAAIEAKQVQVQAALRAQAKVAQSQAEANQTIAKAEGEAKAISLEGAALRNNPEVLRLKAINALNPKAQIIFCSNGDCPSLLGGSFTNNTTGK